MLNFKFSNHYPIFTGDGNHSNGGDGNSSSGITKVIAKNLDFGTTWHNLKDFMKQVGHVHRADILTNRDGKSKGMG